MTVIEHKATILAIENYTFMLDRCNNYLYFVQRESGGVFLFREESAKANAPPSAAGGKLGTRHYCPVIC
jgi:hypothetical protein